MPASSYIRTLFHQFPFVAACKLAAMKTLGKVLDPHFIPSYAQTGEDRILITLFHGVTDGFFVDVGCNEPQTKSNTFELYKRGWHGINIDGNPKLIEKFHRIRPRDTSLCQLVSNEEKELVFTTFKEALVSSVSPEHVAQWKEKGEVESETRVRAVPLSKVLREHKVPSRFQLLSIDVEGHDWEVLTSFSLDEFRPGVIVIEMHNFEFTNPGSNPIYKYLADNGYRLASYAVMNGYFVDDRKS
ncbi:FkbM family methyltransferase [Candidatus Sumerlaeota bacterium]|nr:FkbM family methyltransferase [Candidatus Sumerlaeota bacterium]